MARTESMKREQKRATMDNKMNGVRLLGDREYGYADVKLNPAQGEFQTLKWEGEELEPRVEDAEKKKDSSAKKVKSKRRRSPRR